jgi:hypothetical protein
MLQPQSGLPLGESWHVTGRFLGLSPNSQLFCREHLPAIKKPGLSAESLPCMLTKRGPTVFSLFLLADATGRAKTVSPLLRIAVEGDWHGTG